MVGDRTARFFDTISDGGVFTPFSTAISLTDVRMVTALRFLIV
jgi:hypothetical protein